MRERYLPLLFLLMSVTSWSQIVLGIDVSHHQGNINWTLVANDGKTFAFVKATEGFTYDDPKFQLNMINGVNAGVVMGAYHFARPDNNAATDEANHFVSVAGDYIGNGFLPPVLDLEDPNSYTHLDQLYTPTQLTNWVQTWMNRVEELSGVRPIIYLSSHYANFLQASLNTYGLWIAKPGTSPTSPPNDIGNWNDWDFKQYSWTGSVNGISGNVDLDSYHGTVAGFNEMIQSLSLSELSSSGLRVYPNPAQGEFNIATTHRELDKIEIYTADGQLLKKLSVPDTGRHLVPLQIQNRGIYFIKITDTQGHVSVIKQIID